MPGPEQVTKSEKQWGRMGGGVSVRGVLSQKHVLKGLLMSCVLCSAGGGHGSVQGLCRGCKT
jgi:hypothetical protein